MNLTVSPQMRIVALAGLIAVLGLTLSVMFLSRKGDSSSPANAVAAQPVRPKSSSKAPAPAKPVRPTAAPSKPHVQPAVQSALRAGFPADVAAEFARHDVVIVELYSAEAPIDQLALAEATAGARKAGAGFVGLNVTAREDAKTRAFVTKLGVLNAPALLVFKQPGTLFTQIRGFSDQETVAQAAANAAASTPISR